MQCSCLTDPYIVIINWMVARSASRSMHVVGMRVAAQWLEVGNAGGNVSVVAAAVAWSIICWLLIFFYGRLCIAVSTRGQGRG